VDEHGGKVHVRMEPFRMEVPIDSSAPPSTS
jgi:hypothetical protein